MADTQTQETVEETDASLDASSTSEDAQAGTSEEREKKTLRGGHDPAELARRRWAKDRARKTDEDQQAAHEAKGQAVIVRVPVQVGTIISALAKKAEKGGVAEARELRSYLAEFPVESDTDVSALDRKTRQTLLALLIDDEVMEAVEDGILLDAVAVWREAHPREA